MRLGVRYCQSFHAPADIAVDQAPVYQRGEAVHEQHCQHRSFGVSGVVATYDDRDGADEESVDIFPHSGAASGHGIGSHEDNGEEESSEADLGDGVKIGGRVERRSPVMGHGRHEQTSAESRQDDAPVGDSGEQQDRASDKDAKCGGLSHDPG